MDFSFNHVNVVQSGNQILRNVSGKTLPGELLAIMGPSGAGKTTLLNTLAGRLPYSGEITYGDKLIDKSLKRKACYVLQQDIFFGNLTLQETLEFTAMIRLPDTMTREEKLARLSLVVSDLDLTDCMQTVMGDMFTPGLSGGQKKRASIACELLRDPDLIFLDEPTTGLDSSTASSLISLLKLYAAKGGKTIIASIHQPSSQNFFQFDKLLLLTGGQVAYYGGTSAVVDHFESVGVEMAPNLNPADFMLEVLADNEEVKRKLLAATSRKDSGVNSEQAQSPSVSTHETVGNQSVWSRLMSKFQRNPKYTEANSQNGSMFEDLDTGSVTMSLVDLESTVPDNSSHGNNNDNNWPTSFVTQYTQLTRRTWRESRRRILDVSKLLENLAICAFVSLIFWQLPREEGTLRDRMGAVFFIAAHWGFIPLFDAVASFPMERVVINKERAAGWYRLSAYYLAKMTAELVLILVQPAVFVIIAYWAIGLNGISAFFATLGTVFLDSVAGQSIGLFVGIACLQINQAMTISITLQMAIMLLGGLFTRNIPYWLDWTKYLSFLHYSFHSLVILEFDDAQPLKIVADTLIYGTLLANRVVPDETASTGAVSSGSTLFANTSNHVTMRCVTPYNSSVFPICKEANITDIPSTQVLQYYSVNWAYWQYLVPLLVFTVVFRLLGYLTLRFIRKPV